MTPYEFELIADSYIRKVKAEQDERVALAYMTACWTAQWFSKQKPKKLSEILNKKTVKKEMTDDEMMKVAMALNKVFGGEVI